MMARTAVTDAIGVKRRRRTSARFRCPLGCDPLAGTLPGLRTWPAPG
jgi:hypothetical protein